MATVAQTIGNGGVRMEPYLVEKAFDDDGRTHVRPRPRGGRARDVARSPPPRSTGDDAAGGQAKAPARRPRSSGVDVAGKTGTAELNNNGLNDLWFIGFTDEHAVAVMVERVQGGTGGDGRRADRQGDAGGAR